MTQTPLPPGSTIGILGGGQLGRMMSVAASELGYHVHIYCPEADCPAAEVSKLHTKADYTDEDALIEFAQAVDIITLEFENIPLIAAKTAEKHGKLAPSSAVLEICQHRLKEKIFIRGCDIETAPFAHARDLDEAKAAIDKIGTPCILKTCTMGYDGKGQMKIESPDELETAWINLASDDVIVEGFVPFEKEASVIVARNALGGIACYPLVENIHKNHILHQTIAPGDFSEATQKQAKDIATTLATNLELVGIMAVELFVCGDKLIVNELAPRPHNSGHWSMDACQVSQFEMAIRAVVGLPLLDINQHSSAVMTNLIGHDVNEWKALSSEPNTSLHLYGKKETKPGRKMGHVTRVEPL